MLHSLCPFASQLHITYVVSFLYQIKTKANVTHTHTQTTKLLSFCVKLFLIVIIIIIDAIVVAATFSIKCIPKKIREKIRKVLYSIFCVAHSFFFFITLTFCIFSFSFLYFVQIFSLSFLLCLSDGFWFYLLFFLVSHCRLSTNKQNYLFLPSLRRCIFGNIHQLMLTWRPN